MVSESEKDVNGASGLDVNQMLQGGLMTRIMEICMVASENRDRIHVLRYVLEMDLGLWDAIEEAMDKEEHQELAQLVARHKHTIKEVLAETVVLDSFVDVVMEAMNAKAKVSEEPKNCQDDDGREEG